MCFSKYSVARGWAQRRDQKWKGQHEGLSLVSNTGQVALTQLEKKEDK